LPATAAFGVVLAPHPAAAVAADGWSEYFGLADALGTALSPTEALAVGATLPVGVALALPAGDGVPEAAVGAVLVEPQATSPRHSTALGSKA